MSLIDGRRSLSKLFLRSLPSDVLRSRSRSPKISFDLVRLIRDPKEVVRRGSARSGWIDMLSEEMPDLTSEILRTKRKALLPLEIWCLKQEGARLEGCHGCCSAAGK